MNIKNKYNNKEREKEEQMNSLPKEIKERIVKAREEGYTIKEVMDRLSVGKSTVQRAIARYKEGKSFEVGKSKGRPPKIKEEDLYIIKEAWEEKNDRTLEEIRKIFEGITGIKVSIKAIFTAKKKLNISRKKN